MQSGTPGVLHKGNDHLMPNKEAIGRSAQPSKLLQHRKVPISVILGKEQDQKGRCYGYRQQPKPCRQDCPGKYQQEYNTTQEQKLQHKKEAAIFQKSNPLLFQSRCKGSKNRTQGQLKKASRDVIEFLMLLQHGEQIDHKRTYEDQYKAHRTILPGLLGKNAR